MRVHMPITVLVLTCLVAGAAWSADLNCRVQRDGAPEGGAKVVLMPAGAAQVTDAAGRCKFMGVAAGSYTLRAAKAVGGVLYGAARNITVRADTIIVTVDLRLVRAIELSRYIPISVGDTWQYRATITEATGVVTKTRRERAVGTEVIGGETTVVVEVTESPEGDKRKECVRTSAEGHARYRETRGGDVINYVPPLRFANLWPFLWTETVRCMLHHDGGAPDEAMTMELQYTGVAGVTVPAGAFTDCVHLSGKQTMAGRTRRLEMWLARGVGIVKSEERESGKEYKRVRCLASTILSVSDNYKCRC